MATLDFDSAGLTYVGVGSTVRALDDVELSVADGESVAIIGPSGCGKSSMLLLASGLLAPTVGEMRVAGSPVSGTRRTTALILQDFGLLPWKTVRHNAALGLEIRGVARPEIAKRVHSSLDSVGLAEFENAYPGELSGGMRQRLAVARALALDADLLLMDEPLSALDALTREDLQGLLLCLWQDRGHTSVLVTHSIEEAVFLGQRVVVLTPRPGSVARIVDNPGVGESGHRESVGFYERCAEVRRILAEEGAVGGSAEVSVPGVAR
ncbi:MAG: ABC transporter ATP-binding protein [Actinomycetota bacterium]|nr:ABC transporter ATP-binding protein [Actinomycetota bacterium]